MNKILLTKLTWRLLKTPEALWDQELVKKYSGLAQLKAGKILKPASHIWRGIELGYETLQPGLDFYIITTLVDTVGERDHYHQVSL